MLLESITDNPLKFHEIAFEDGRVFNSQYAPIPTIGSVITLQDITHLKMLDRLKSDFIHTISHDLRSPLTAVMGYVELLDRLDDAWRTVGHRMSVQGNLDPAILLSTPQKIREEAQDILDQAAGRPGHVFNLGHGILQQTPVDNVIALVDAVHELRARK